MLSTVVKLLATPLGLDASYIDPSNLPGGAPGLTKAGGIAAVFISSVKSACHCCKIFQFLGYRLVAMFTRIYWFKPLAGSTLVTLRSLRTAWGLHAISASRSLRISRYVLGAKHLR